MGMSHHEGVKTKETDGSGCGQKSTTSLSLSMEAYGLEEEGGAFHHAQLSIGQKEFGLENVGTNKKKRG